MLKRFSYILSLSFIFCLGGIFTYEGHGQELGKIAAVVNDHIISTIDLEYRLKLALISSGLENTPEVRKNLLDQILKAMIDETLQKTTAAKFDIKASETEVLQAFDELENRNGLQPGQMKEMFKSNNIPLEVIYNQIRANLSWREYIQARYQSSVQIGEQDIDRVMKQYELKKDQPHLLLAEIFLSTDGTDETKVKRKAEEFAAEIRKGAPFMALAQQFSQSASAARGGDIGWLSEDQLDPDLASAVKNLQPNQITDPIKTQNGYYILTLRERRAPGESIGKDTLVTFMQVLFPVSQPFSDEKLHPAFVKAKSIGSNSKSCGLLKTLVKGDQSIQVKEVPKAHMRDMAPQLKDLLRKLSVGNASEPILTDIGFIVFMVCDMEDINPDNPSRNDVRGTLFEKKLEQLAQREMRNLRHSAHIDIRV